MMGKEKFTRDKPHVNTPGVGDRQVSDGTSTSGASDDMPAESISFNYSKLETGAHHVEPDHADQLAAPPLASTGGDRPMESLALNFSKLGPDADGPSTLASLSPDEPVGGLGGPDTLTMEVEEVGMLLPAVQKVREAAASMGDEAPDDLELEL